MTPKKRASWMIGVIVPLLIAVAVGTALLRQPTDPKPIPSSVTETWSTAVLLDLQIEPKHGWSRVPKVEVRVRYEYEVDGRRYVGTRYDSSGKPVVFGTWNLQAMQFAERLKGLKQVWYNPANPSESVLVPQGGDS